MYISSQILVEKKIRKHKTCYLCFLFTMKSSTSYLIKMVVVLFFSLCSPDTLEAASMHYSEIPLSLESKEL